MRKREFFTSVATIAIIILAVMYTDDSSKRSSVRYDCRLAEISPDIPAEVKEVCRKRAMERSR